MKHPDSIRTYRITWRTDDTATGETYSHHAYTDDPHAAGFVSQGLRCNSVIYDVEVRVWDNAAQGYVGSMV